MSIASEISRLQLAKSELVSNINANYYSAVSSSTLLNDLASYPQNIMDALAMGKTPNEIKILTPTSSIRAGAFYNCNSLSKITINALSDSTFILNDDSLRNCQNLSSFIFQTEPSSFKIKPYAFYRCYKLSDIPYSSKINDLGNYAFYQCSSITKVDLPSYTSEPQVGGLQGVFYGCSNISMVNLSNFSGSLGNAFFQGCVNLASVNIPLCKTITNTTFSGCTSLTTLNLPSLASVNTGGLFRYIPNLQTLSLGAITTVVANGFGSCSNLTSLTLPSTLTQMSSSVFNQTPNLTSIAYMGTMAQWGNVTLNTRWLSGTGVNVHTVHCTDGDISL